MLAEIAVICYQTLDRRQIPMYANEAWKWTQNCSGFVDRVFPVAVLLARCSFPHIESLHSLRAGETMAMMNLRPGISFREFPMSSVRSAGSPKRQLAKVVFGTVLVAVSASSAYAATIKDTFKIEAIFTGGVHGAGSFTTDGICVVCTEASGLSNFTFSVLDASLGDADALIGNFTFTRQTLFVQSLFMKDSLTGDSINFTPIQPGPGTFSSIWIDSGLPKFSNNGVVTLVPEPSSLILVLTALAVTATWRVRALRLNVRTGNAK
jgi:hypothetical protein